MTHKPMPPGCEYHTAISFEKLPISLSRRSTMMSINSNICSYTARWLPSRLCNLCQPQSLFFQFWSPISQLWAISACVLVDRIDGRAMGNDGNNSPEISCPLELVQLINKCHLHELDSIAFNRLPQGLASLLRLPAMNSIPRCSTENLL